MQRINVSINDTSRILGVGRTKVYGLIAEGKLKSVQIGRLRGDNKDERHSVN